jgi:hypothetical protein
MSAMRLAVILGLVFVVVGAVYWFLQQGATDPEAVSDAAGALLLVMLGASMAFGFFVILRGAREP